MNPNAFKILQKHALPIPCIFSFEEALNADATDRFYLRYDGGLNLSNRVCTSAELLDNRNKFALDIEREVLIKIEKVYKFQIGGATLVKPHFSYTECVVGHLRALLRDGVCGARIVIEDTGVVFQQTVYQGWKAVQRMGTAYEWEPSLGVLPSELFEVVEKLTNTLPQSHSGLLLEWFLCEDGLLFCDARDSGLDEFGNTLCELSTQRIPLEIQNCKGHVQSCRVDQLSVDLFGPPLPSDLMVICNGALLCHYIMRNFNRGIGIKIGVDING